MPFIDIYISQTSVTTCLWRSGIFKHEFVKNLLLSPSVKKVWKSVIFGKVTGKSLVSCFFDSRCTQGEVTSQYLESRYDRHFVGITRYNPLS